jgi:hypothetical protein
MADKTEQSKQILMQPVSDTDVEALTLGESSELLAFSSLDEACKLLRTMIDQGQHRLIYFGPAIEAGLLGDNGVSASIGSLFRRNRSATMKTLVNHSQELVHTGQRVIELMRNLMPAVECRIRRPQSAGFGGACVLVDYSGYLFFPNPDRHKGSASFNGVADAEKLYDVFIHEWEVGEPDPEIRPLYI